LNFPGDYELVVIHDGKEYTEETPEDDYITVPGIKSENKKNRNHPKDRKNYQENLQNSSQSLHPDQLEIIIPVDPEFHQRKEIIEPGVRFMQDVD
jgi:hypothetical protein